MVHCTKEEYNLQGKFPNSMDNLDEQISKLLEDNLSLKVVKDAAKVKCTLSGHEMPCKPAAIESYINGKKYKRLKSANDLNIQPYMRHLVPDERSRDVGKKLYCKLTSRIINNEPSHIHRHVQGRRFKKAFYRWEECQKSGEVFVPRKPLYPKDNQETEEQEVDGEALWDPDDDEEENDQNQGSSFVDSSGDSEDDEGNEDASSDVSDFEFEMLGHSPQGDTEGAEVSAEANGMRNKRKQVEDHKSSKKAKVEAKVSINAEAATQHTVKQSKKKKLKAK